jgi:hypothetical protein
METPNLTAHIQRKQSSEVHPQNLHCISATAVAGTSEPFSQSKELSTKEQGPSGQAKDMRFISSPQGFSTIERLINFKSGLQSLGPRPKTGMCVLSSSFGMNWPPAPNGRDESTSE